MIRNSLYMSKIHKEKNKFRGRGSFDRPTGDNKLAFSLYFPFLDEVWKYPTS